MADNAVKAASDYYKVVLENDRVRVLEYRGKPGDKTTKHHHSDLVAIPLSSGKFKLTTPEGQSFEIDLTPGEPVFAPAQDHVTENIGSTDGHVLLVELK